MAVHISKGDVNATISGYAISCSNPQWQMLLNALRDPEGPSGADPNPEYTLAMEAVRIFKFTIDHVTEPPTRHDCRCRCDSCRKRHK